MSETIAAIATAQVPSAIGILRISGDNTLAILNQVFRSKSLDTSIQKHPRQMLLGSLLSKDGAVIDDVLCTYFPAPRSYTGEDCAEIYCHGSPIVLDEGLLSIFASGARQATGGEFTKRAFLNGHMDLIQAEAVVDLIDAESLEAAKNAAGQLSGVLSSSVNHIYDGLMDIVSRFYAVVDYPDEDIEDLQREQMLDTLRESEQKLESLLSSFSRGKLLKLGVPSVIVGKPNAGKSSLLNALLGYDRAIVTNIPGTTRDTIEEKVNLGDVLLRLCDTAGVHESNNMVESMGIERTRQAVAKSSLALLVLDGSLPITAEDEEVMALLKDIPNTIVVVNKSDLPRALDIESLVYRFSTVISLSCETGEGIDTLVEAIQDLYPKGSHVQGELLTNARQADAVSRALTAIKSARASLRIGMTPDVILTDAEAALEALGELNGKNIKEDLVSTIFSRFCVGK